jgi:hypothetical protein
LYWGIRTIAISMSAFPYIIQKQKSKTQMNMEKK